MKTYLLVEFRGSDDETGRIIGVYKDKKQAKKQMHRCRAKIANVVFRWHESWSYCIYSIDL